MVSGSLGIDDGASWDDATKGKSKKHCVLISFNIVSRCELRCLKSSCMQIALGGRYSRDFFNRQGELRHIRRLRFWPLSKVLMEKYDFSEEDAIAMQEFIIPILEFVPEKRPTAAQCLTHPWMNPVPRSLKPSPSPQKPNEEEEASNENKTKETDEREAMEVGVGNIAIDGSESKTSAREGRQSARDIHT